MFETPAAELVVAKVESRLVVFGVGLDLRCQFVGLAELGRLGQQLQLGGARWGRGQRACVPRRCCGTGLVHGGQCLGGMPLQVLGQARLCTAHQSDPVHGRDRVGRCNTAAELAPRQAGRCQWVAQHLRALEPMLGLWRVCGHGQAMQRQQPQQPRRIGRR